MARYQARAGGMFGSGVYPQQQNGVNVDVVGLADVIANALASRRDGLIRKAMLQRENDRQDRMDQQAQEDRLYQRQQAEAAAQSADEERQYTRARQARIDDLSEAKTASEIAKTRAENGIVPDRYAPAPTAGPDLVSSFQPPSIRSAYMSGGSAVGQFQAPSVAEQPAPIVGTLPSFQLLPGFTDRTLGTKYQDEQRKREQTNTDLQANHQANRLFDLQHPTSAEQGVGGPVAKFQADQKNKILDDYSRDTQDFRKVMGGWEVLQGAIKNPTLATPFAVTDAYARITNPGAIVRPTTMEMIHDMGSVGQRMEKYWSQHANGSLPPDILEDFKKTLGNIVEEHKKQYDQVRRKAIVRAKQAGITDIEPILEDYSMGGESERPPLTPEDAAHAKRDPNYKAWLLSKGYQL